MLNLLPEKLQNIVKAHLDGVYVFSARAQCDLLLTEIFQILSDKKPVLQFEKPTIEHLITFAMSQYASDCQPDPVTAYLELFHYDANDENDEMGWEHHTGILAWCYFENVRAFEFLGFVDDMVESLMRFLGMDKAEFYQWQIANTR